MRSAKQSRRDAEHVIVIFVASLIITLLYSRFHERALGAWRQCPIEFRMALALVLAFLVVFSWRNILALVKKYLRTCGLEKSPFTWIDTLVVFLAFSTSAFLFFTDSIGLPMSIALVAIACAFVWSLRIFIASRFFPPVEVEKTGYSLSDEPIEDEQEDILERGQFVERVFKEVQVLPQQDSFVFGLYGSWGEGKTSVLNLVRKRFMQEETQNYIIVEFDPWQFKDEEAFLAAFYEELEKAVSKQYIIPRFKRVLSKYQKFISSGLSYVGFHIGDLVKDESLQEQRAKIQSKINQISKKILIVIDNIDRLQPKEIMLVLKLVRVNAKFQNTIFLLSLDDRLVRNQLEQLNCDQEFLEKIVQTPFPLPAVEQRDIDRFLSEHTKKLFEAFGIEQEERAKFTKSFSEIYEPYLSKLFDTLRKAKVYLNNLCSILPLIKDEVNLRDLFVFQALRMFYPQVYYDIVKKPWYYIEDLEAPQFLPFSLMIPHDERDKLIEGHLKAVIGDQEHEDVLKKLLTSTFEIPARILDKWSMTDFSNARSEKRITDCECFSKCLLLRVPRGALADKEVENLIEQWNKTERPEAIRMICKAFADMKSRGLLFRFLGRLWDFKDKIDSRAAAAVVTGIYSDPSLFSHDAISAAWVSEYREACRLLLVLVNSRVDKADIQKTLKEVVSNTPNLAFAAHIVALCRKNGGRDISNIYESVDIEMLQKALIDRLEKAFIKDNRDIFQELPESWQFVIVLYQWATYRGATVIDYLISLAEKRASEVVTFLTDYSKDRFSDKLNIDARKVTAIFEASKLKDLAKKLIGNTSLTAEQDEAIESFIADIDKITETKKGT